MEDFGARTQPSDPFCRGKVGECDIFVGVTGHLFGNCPEGSTTSFTVGEYEAAVEAGKPRLMFVAPSDFALPSSLREPDWKWTLQQGFRSRIDKENLRASFDSPQGLAASVVQAIHNWEKEIQEPRDRGLSIRFAGTMPPLPPLFVGREGFMQELRGRLISRLQRIGQRVVVVSGVPGVGKTELVAAMAHDASLAASFPDGVLWTAIQGDSDLLTELLNWSRALGIESLAGTPDEASAQLATALRDRRALLIIDDVWKASQAKLFLVGGKACAAIVTTRDNEVAEKLAPSASDVRTLPVLSEEHSMELLKLLAPTVVASHPTDTIELTRVLGNLPLALQVAGRLLNAEARSGLSVAELLQDLKEGRRLLESPPPIGPGGNGGSPTVSILLEKSTSRLDAEARECFARLGAFAPKPAKFNLAAMREIWKVADARPMARLLVNRGLLEPMGDGWYTMHALLVLHAQSLWEE